VPAPVAEKPASIAGPVAFDLAEVGHRGSRQLGVPGGAVPIIVAGASGAFCHLGHIGANKRTRWKPSCDAAPAPSTSTMNSRRFFAPTLSSAQECARGFLATKTRPSVLRRLSARQAMPVQFQKPWINSAPRWWMTQRTRPAWAPRTFTFVGTAGCRPQKGDRIARHGRAQ